MVTKKQQLEILNVIKAHFGDKVEQELLVSGEVVNLREKKTEMANMEVWRKQIRAIERNPGVASVG